MKKQYINSIIEKIEQLRNDNNIEAAAQLLASAIESKRIIYSFGASHAGIITEETVYRAGGLAVINPIFDKNLMLDVKPITKTSQIENLPQYGTIIAQNVGFKEGDVLITHSVSGRNAVMIDLALHAKACGVQIIAITNLAYSQSVASKHESKKRLFELADVVIDNHGDIGDATVSINGLPQKVAPTSTVIGAAIVNCIVVEVANILHSKGIEPPIFFSANLDGTAEANELLFKKYAGQIKYMQ
ncbi:MAG: SIS domain-containing protein [Alphaproteobacteria bacterium]|jgi:uncharacterized phosphosugar-binding protein|nr:SIS domain-containing protein [Alphaproteobacteria bacterium]